MLTLLVSYSKSILMLLMDGELKKSYTLNLFYAGTEETANQYLLDMLQSGAVTCLICIDSVKRQNAVSYSL